MNKLVNMINSILDKISGDSELSCLGAYEQGSYILGYADEFSDRDFIVFWEKNLPRVNSRIKILKNEKAIIHEVKNVAQIDTGFDLFEVDNQLVNIAHKVGLEKLEDIKAIKVYSVESLRAVYNLQKAHIIFDPTKKIKNIQNQAIIKDEDKKIFIETFSTKISYLLRELEIAVKRDSKLRFLNIYAEILDYLSILSLLKDDLTVVYTKWYEKTIADPDLKQIYENISRDINLESWMSKIFHYANQIGIKPSKTLRA